MVIEENAAECDLEKKQNEGPKIVRNSRRPGIQISMWNHQIDQAKRAENPAGRNLTLLQTGCPCWGRSREKRRRKPGGSQQLCQ